MSSSEGETVPLAEALEAFRPAYEAGYVPSPNEDAWSASNEFQRLLALGDLPAFESGKLVPRSRWTTELLSEALTSSAWTVSRADLQARIDEQPSLPSDRGALPDLPFIPLWSALIWLATGRYADAPKAPDSPHGLTVEETAQFFTHLQSQDVGKPSPGTERLVWQKLRRLLEAEKVSAVGKSAETSTAETIPPYAFSSDEALWPDSSRSALRRGGREPRHPIEWDWVKIGTAGLRRCFPIGGGANASLLRVARAFMKSRKGQRVRKDADLREHLLSVDPDMTAYRFDQIYPTIKEEFPDAFRPGRWTGK